MREVCYLCGQDYRVKNGLCEECRREEEDVSVYGNQEDQESDE